MTFQPVVVGTGLVGWQFLQATYDDQFEAFTKSTVVQRDAEYFRQNIGAISSAEDLVADRRLLSVALGAFGLSDDLNNRFFIQKVLEDGVTSDDALANRLSDDRYHDLSKAFGFGPGETASVDQASFVEHIISRFETQAFETALGEKDDTMRIALYGDRTLQDMAVEDKSETTLWYNILGEPPLKKLFQTAFGLPSGVGQVEIEKQAEIFQDRAVAMFGDSSIAQFADGETRQKLIRTYMARVLIDQSGGNFSPAATALQLLQS